ncbi:hypothetical protein COV11_04575 [Candidatus Woesearchaeota archaeon CG10_big_fil_rev_8_21_14_0_10_30_7]|nr:MAG: hypothetical protein COV11_04575 [Candidatus Woesearchaeota archaeon CG10_big_fil_rev_8_21_14_0_10_30_7]
MNVFVDSSVLCAYMNVQDVHNKKAVSIMKDLFSDKDCIIVINDYVFDEIMAVTTRRTSKKNALKLGEYLTSSEIYLMSVNDTIFRTAWKYFHGQWNFSFTDCIILAFMRIFGITKIATFDKEFEKVKDIEIIN